MVGLCKWSGAFLGQDVIRISGISAGILIEVWYIKQKGA